MRYPFVSVPIDIPKVEPSSWDEWWTLWHREADLVEKTVKTHNPTTADWIGFDIYNTNDPGFNPAYHCKNVNCLSLFPELEKNLHKIPMDIACIRAFCNFKKAITPHRDTMANAISIRTLLHDTNPHRTFYYDTPDGKVYQELPEETNTWMYAERSARHGADYYEGKMKILIAYYGEFSSTRTMEQFSISETKYKDFIIYK